MDVRAQLRVVVLRRVLSVFAEISVALNVFASSEGGLLMTKLTTNSMPSEIRTTTSAIPTISS